MVVKWVLLFMIVVGFMFDRVGKFMCNNFWVKCKYIILLVCVVGSVVCGIDYDNSDIDIVVIIFKVCGKCVIIVIEQYYVWFSVDY